MPNLHFMPRMVDPILNRTKPHTVRFGDRTFQRGQFLYMQTGSRYQPKRFAVLPCLRVRDIYVRSVGVVIWEERKRGFTVPQRDFFAQCDGFIDWQEMLDWLHLEEGQEKRGQLIQWIPAAWEKEPRVVRQYEPSD